MDNESSGPSCSLLVCFLCNWENFNYVPMKRKKNCYCFCFCFPFFCLTALQHIEFPDQGSDPSHGCNLSHSCGNAGSLTHYAGPAIEPVFECSQEATNPIVPQRELLVFWGFFKYSWFNVVSISAVQQSDPVIHIYTFPFLHYLHHGLSQEAGCRSLCCTIEWEFFPRLPAEWDFFFFFLSS